VDCKFGMLLNMFLFYIYNDSICISTIDFMTNIHLQIGLVYVIITTVLFVFPPELPVTGSNMSESSPSPKNPLKLTHPKDYCIVAFFIWFVISIIQWIVDGRKNFTGPKIDIAALQSGEMVGQTIAEVPVESNSSGSEIEKRESHGSKEI